MKKNNNKGSLFFTSLSVALNGEAAGAYSLQKDKTGGTAQAATSPTMRMC